MAQTKSGQKFYVSPTPANADLTLTEYQALADWVLIENTGNIGELGSSANIVTYDELSTAVTQKAKGVTNAGDPAIECAYNPNSAPGQELLATMGVASNKNSYPIKIERNDAPSASMTNTIQYSRGIVTGPIFNGGSVDDNDLVTFNVGLSQEPFTVKPTAI